MPLTDIGNLDRPPACKRCAQGELRASHIDMAFWQGRGLLVIRGVPAHVCSLCGDRSLSGQTALDLDRICGEGLDPSGISARMEVPVLDFAASCQAP